MKFRSAVLALFLSGAILVPGVATASEIVNNSSASATSFPELLIDGGDMFSSDEEQILSEILSANYEKYDLHFVVETIPSLEGKKLEDVSLSRANELAVGEADSDNGVYVLISREDRKIRFELGAGVTAKVTNSEMKTIINSTVTPDFKKDNYVEGVVSGMSNVGKEYIGETVGLNSPSSETEGTSGGDFATMLGLVALASLFLVAMIYAFNHAFGEPSRQRAEELARNASVARLNRIKNTVRSLKTLPAMKEYKTLPNKEERAKWLEKHEPAFYATLQEHSNGKSVRVSFLDDELYTPIVKSMNMSEHIRKDASLSKVFYKTLTNQGFENFSIDQANKHIDKYNKVAQRENEKRWKQQAKTANERRKAREIWDSLPLETRQKLKKAKTDTERKKLIEGTSSQYDFFTYLPIMSAMFLSSGSSSSSSYSSNSSSSGSSSSSSYDSGFSSGGSFDGGGGSGSW